MEQQTLSDLERGKNATSAKLPDIAFRCEVEPLWLVRGEGQMVAPMQATPDSSSNQLLLAVIALVDTVSARTPTEARGLRDRLRAARKQQQEKGLDAPLLQNLEGVVEAALASRKHGRSSKKR
jgi:hypothetical protein